MNIKATRRNDTNDFRINFRYVFVHAKNDSVNGMQENLASSEELDNCNFI